MKTLRRFLLLVAIPIVLMLVVPGCGGDDDDDGGTTASSISGVASKGPIKGGTVSVYKIIDEQKGDFIGTATSGTDGSYSINIGGHAGPVLVEIKGGTYTDEATGNEINLAMTLRAAISNPDGEVTVAVTPLTDLAVRKAEPGGLNSDKIDSSNRLISQLLGGNGAQDLVTQTLPVDVTDATACGGADNDQKQYGLLLAALSQMAQDTSMNIEEVIDQIEEDMEDLLLDSTGGALSAALDTFLDSDNNKTGMSAADIDLDEHIDDATTEGMTPTGSLAEAEELLAAFLNDATDDNYNSFMSYMDSFVPDSEEAHLFKGMASLFDIYENSAVSFIKDLGIDLDANFDELDGEQILCDFLASSDPDYEGNIKGLLAQIEDRLDAVDADLEQAQGVNAYISLVGINTVHLDDIDVKILRTITQVWKAICVYVQAVDIGVDDWNITGGDIRELIRDGNELTDEQMGEFYNNNPNLLTYSDIDRLTDFKTAFQSAADQFSSAVDALDALGENRRRLRYHNAFNFDSELDLWLSKALAEETFPSILRAFNNSAEDIVEVDDKRTDCKIIVHEDGYAYCQDTLALSLVYLEPVADNITIYDLVSGSKSPRDVVDADATVDDYEPYVDNPAKQEIYRENVTDTDWDEPIDTYTVPVADTIEIDGNAGDWNSISTFRDDGHTKVKIARDGEGNFYLYVSKPAGFEPGNEYGNYKYSLSGCMPDHWENDFRVSLYFYWEDTEGCLWAEVNDSSGRSKGDSATIKTGDTVIGGEAKYPTPAFNRLVEAGSINGYWYDENHYRLHWEDIKLLPETE